MINSMLVSLFNHWYKRWMNPACYRINGIYPPGHGNFAIVGEKIRVRFPRIDATLSSKINPILVDAFKPERPYRVPQVVIFQEWT